MVGISLKAKHGRFEPKTSHPHPPLIIIPDVSAEPSGYSVFSDRLLASILGTGGVGS